MSHSYVGFLRELWFPPAVQRRAGQSNWRLWWWLSVFSRRHTQKCNPHDNIWMIVSTKERHKLDFCCFRASECVFVWNGPLFVTADNREEEGDEEVQIENRERPFSCLNHHFCIRSRRGGSGSADFLLPAERGGARGGAAVPPVVLAPTIPCADPSCRKTGSVTRA